MSEKPTPEENLADEFHNLGQNLLGVLRAAWENPERKRVQQEFEKGLSELGTALKREAEYFAESPTSQRLKADVEGISERIRTTETQEKVRQEVLNILQTANVELQKVIERWAPGQPGETPETPSPESSDEAS